MTTTATVLAGQAAAASLLPLLLAPLGVVGVVGTAGLTMMSLQECGGPVRCVSSSNQCCFLLFNFQGALCPASC